MRVLAKEGPGGGEANIKRVEVQLPKLLPARLTTLQKSCTQLDRHWLLRGAQGGAGVSSLSRRSCVGTAAVDLAAVPALLLFP